MDLSEANLSPSALDQWNRLADAGMEPVALVCSCGKNIIIPGNHDGLLESIWLSDHYGVPGHEVNLVE